MFDFSISQMFSAAIFEEDFYHKERLLLLYVMLPNCLIVLSPLTAILKLRNFTAS